jgi:hypothetical protein
VQRESRSLCAARDLPNGTLRSAAATRAHAAHMSATYGSVIHIFF